MALPTLYLLAQWQWRALPATGASEPVTLDDVIGAGQEQPQTKWAQQSGYTYSSNLHRFQSYAMQYNVYLQYSINTLGPKHPRSTRTRTHTHAHTHTHTHACTHTHTHTQTHINMLSVYDGLISALEMCSVNQIKFWNSFRTENNPFLTQIRS